MATLRRALLAIFVLNFVSAVAQESAERERPEKFLMLLTPGDKVSWSISTEMGGYRLVTYPANTFAEMAKDRTARQEEIKKLKAEMGDTRISPSDRNSTDPDVQRRVQASQRLAELQVAERRFALIGTVAFVGTDYIAVTRESDEWQEQLIPAWRIVQIGRYKERKSATEAK